jgi:hypothetical protein
VEHASDTTRPPLHGEPASIAGPIAALGLAEAVLLERFFRHAPFDHVGPIALGCAVVVAIARALWIQKGRDELPPYGALIIRVPVMQLLLGALLLGALVATAIGTGEPPWRGISVVGALREIGQAIFWLFIYAGVASVPWLISASVVAETSRRAVEIAPRDAASSSMQRAPWRTGAGVVSVWMLAAWPEQGAGLAALVNAATGLVVAAVVVILALALGDVRRLLRRGQTTPPASPEGYRHSAPREELPDELGHRDRRVLRDGLRRSAIAGGLAVATLAFHVLVALK